MARKNPLDTIKNAALGTLMAPIGVAEKAVGQVGRVAGAGVGAVTSLVPGKKTSKEKSPEHQAPEQKAPDQKAPEQKAPAPAKSGSVKAAGSLKTGGDPLARAKKAPAPAKPRTQSEPDAKQAPAPSKPKSDPTAKKAPAAKKAPVKKAPVKKAALPKPVNVTRELGLDPAPVKVPAAAASESKPVTSIDAKADADEVVATPADVAAVLSTHHDEGATDGDRPATLS